MDPGGVLSAPFLLLLQVVQYKHEFWKKKKALLLTVGNLKKGWDDSEELKKWETRCSLYKKHFLREGQLKSFK
jgi:hypothetical protein